MCLKGLGPLGVGTDNRKKSPKPTRYMRTRKPFGFSPEEAGVGADGPDEVFCREVLEAFLALPALAALAAPRLAFLAVFRLEPDAIFFALAAAIFQTPACNRPKL